MRKFTIVLSLAMAIFTAGAAQAANQYDQCFTEAAQKYSLDPVLLKAIAKTESGFNPRAISQPNNNGSVDIGMMQINSSWLPKLSRFGISEAHLLQPCTNIHVGAWVLANNIKQMGPTWKAVGAYNSPTRVHQERYAQKVWSNYNVLARSEKF